MAEVGTSVHSDLNWAGCDSSKSPRCRIVVICQTTNTFDSSFYRFFSVEKLEIHFRFTTIHTNILATCVRCASPVHRLFTVTSKQARYSCCAIVTDANPAAAHNLSCVSTCFEKFCHCKVLKLIHYLCSDVA